MILREDIPPFLLVWAVSFAVLIQSIMIFTAVLVSNCFADSHQVKPTIWACDPGTVAYNCARMGLPGPGEEGLVLAMPFWEEAGSKVYDYSGNQNNGVLEGGCSRISTIKGSAIKFTQASDDRINADFDLPAMTTSNKFSWEVIFYCDAGPTDNVIIGNRYGGGPGVSFIKLTQKEFVYYRNGVDEALNFTDLAQYTWNHVWVTKDGTTLKIYVNGVYADTSEIAGGMNANPFWIGGDGVSENWPGIVALVRLWDNVALSFSAIQTLYNNPYGMFEPIKWPIWNYSGAPAATFPQIIVVQ